MRLHYGRNVLWLNSCASGIVRKCCVNAHVTMNEGFLGIYISGGVSVLIVRLVAGFLKITSEFWYRF